MNELVTVKIYTNQVDMHIAKSFLESEGIQCQTQDELIMQVAPLYSNAIGGVKLNVPAAQAEEAVRLLIQGGFAKKEDYEIPEDIKRTGKVVDWLKNLFK